ncbi:MAG: FAD-dependent oxidoreductase [Chitinophagaceae bacterium]
MQRDGALTSLWQYDMPEYKSQTTKIPDKLFDVIVVGGGITGVTTALLLQKTGRNCLLLEAHTLGFGTTGGTTAHINTLLDTPYSEIEKKFGEKNAQLIATITRAAINQIKKNIEDYKIECSFEELPAYLFSQDKDQTKQLDEIAEASKKVGLKLEYSNKIPIPIPFEKAIKVEAQAKFHPTEYLFAIAKAYEDAGGIIVQNCRVNNVDETDVNVEEADVVHVETSVGKTKARQLIYATHIPPGINVLHLRCAPYRSYAMAITLKNKAQYPDALVYDLYEPYHYYRTQLVKGKKYLIAGGEDHKTAHEKNTDACFLHLESYIRKYFDVDEIAFKWSSQYFEPADGLPYIGHLPGNPGNIFVATGYGGNGMVYSNVAALVLKDLLVDDSKNEYIDLFNPNRIKPVAGFTNFAKENLDVAKQLIGKLFSAKKLEVLAGIANGEGKVVKFEDHTIALYKDDTGNLHAVNPSCTHMKCTVSWNIAEKSWDCPCHGARYDCNGKVLTGPADRDLEIIELESLIEEEK